MSIEKLREVIRQSKESAPNQQCRQVIEEFEEFIELYNQREQHRGDVEFSKQVNASYKRFWTSFQQSAHYFGLTPEMLKEQLEKASRQREQEGQVTTAKGQFFASNVKKLRRKDKYQMRI